MTVGEFFERNRTADGRAFLATSFWIDERNGQLRLNTPVEVSLVHPQNDISELWQLARASEAARESHINPAASPAELGADLPSSETNGLSNGGVVTSDSLKRLAWILAIPAVAIAYYFGIALPANNEARLALEKERYSAEQRRMEAESTRVRQEATSRQEALDLCFAGADDAYWKYVKLNGTERKDGTVSAAAHVWNTADKRKNDERDTCFKRYPVR